MADSPTMTYGGYLKLDELLACQEPKTRAHDELLFVIIHQVYELWFKQILHEAALLQRRLEEGNSAGSLHTARRIAKILKTVVGQLDVLETMTPRQFAAFRDALGNSSGFQSEQFREIEAVLGRRGFPPRTCAGTSASRRPSPARRSSTRCCATSPVAGCPSPRRRWSATSPGSGSRTPASRRCSSPSTPTSPGRPPRCARRWSTSTRASRNGGTGI